MPIANSEALDAIETVNTASKTEGVKDRQTEVVQEYVDSRGMELRIDRSRGVLRDVKLLGLKSRNGRSYRESALRQSIGLYEGAKVNVNHPERNPLGPRDYRDRLGVVRNVRMESGVGLFGDLHYNPKHALSEQLSWDAEHAPENVGLSHNVLARTSRTGKGVLVEEITRVQSVDLVADPATTVGLFEQTIESTDSPCDGDSVAKLTEQRDALLNEVNHLKEERDSAARKLLVQRLLVENGLGARGDSLGELFLEELYRMADEERLVQLIEEHARLERTREMIEHAPLSQEQAPFGARPVSEDTTDAASGFVAAISRSQ